MKIVYCGCGKFGIDSLNAIKASGHTLAHIITHPAKQAGRGQKLRPNDIEQWALENKTHFSAIEDINTATGIALLRKLAPDLLVVIAFGQKISLEIISIPPKGAINVHGSLLPKYRGAAPINWAIINDEKFTGISVITLAQTMDAGEILATAELKIAEDDTAGDIHDALAKLAAPLLVQTIDKIAAGTAEYKKQDNSKASKAPKLSKTVGFLDFADSAQNIHNKVRGLCPWPGATATFVNAKAGKKIPAIIVKTQIISTDGKNAQFGTIDENLNILCGTGSLKIIELKPQGGKIMDLKSFLNGRGSGKGDYFITPESDV
ncbi:MAG TPA: methionyl-tRNA formyltransferase [Phycisphaerales bacterium]|nr:MAG: methionyl-tRNA formyltransferase [Planctomycetes bacterium GWC2_45_44]HBG77824.1 methionyl-tRNA formyltransferase [Phycisphaerales bacterium]HBR18909.1 methionyl-tRNA formyltransferase [Phycisphaerales bacterium]